MNEQLTNEFINLISTYDMRDLMSLLIICSIQYLESDSDKDAYEGAKNLFSKIITHYEYKSQNKHIDFYNENECNEICNIMMSYLSKKYWDDHNDLSNLVKQGIISEKQFLYELSSPKTYPKTFVDSLSTKIRPFEDFLIQRYKLNVCQIQDKCEKLIRSSLKNFTGMDVIAHKATLINGFFPESFLNDLISVNEKTSKINDINSFDKFVCFPVAKVEDEYHLLSAEVFIDNFYKCIHRLCFKNSSQSEKDLYSNLKGKLFNEACEGLLKGFGFNNVYGNYSYDGGEIDILVEDNDMLFVVECKARNYTDKVSGISNSFVKANDSNLDHASNQIHRFLDSLKKKKHILLRKNSDIVNVKIDNYSIIIPLVINIDNLAELNADFENRTNETIYISFDDLLIINEVIKDRRWLLVDFFSQILGITKKDASSDDIIDMFAFYCQCKNLGILFDEKTNVIIYKLGNDYFQDYFAYRTNIKPIKSFDNDVATFKPIKEFQYRVLIDEYHKKHWKTIADIINI